jgi:hypothetical protein
MAGKLSPTAQTRLATLQQVAEKVQHVHGLVERFATLRDPRQAEQYAPPMKRAFGRLKVELMGLGLDSMSQLAAAMEIASGRSGSIQTKGRILREGVGSLRFQVEQEQKQVVREDEAARSRADAPGGSEPGEGAPG